MASRSFAQSSKRTPSCKGSISTVFNKNGALNTYLCTINNTTWFVQDATDRILHLGAICGELATDEGLQERLDQQHNHSLKRDVSPRLPF